MNFDALLSYLQTTPLTWLILTIASYKVGIIIYEKSNKFSLLQPIFTSYIVLISAVLLTDTSFEHYFESVQWIHFLLGVATVALALPLYHNLKFIKRLFVPIIITLVFGSIFSVVVAILILLAFDVNTTTILSMTTKSITAPIAIITSEQIGAIPSLAITFILITGITGALFGTFIFKLMNIKNETSKGFALGLVSHGIGVGRAIELGTKAAAFGSLAMGLCGVFTAILLPIILQLLQ